jgi:hypothetical protein
MKTVESATTIEEAIELLPTNYNIIAHMRRLLLEDRVRERRAVLREAAQTPGLAEALLSQGED